MNLIHTLVSTRLVYHVTPTEAKTFSSRFPVLVEQGALQDSDVEFNKIDKASGIVSPIYVDGAVDFNPETHNMAVAIVTTKLDEKDPGVLLFNMFMEYILSEDTFSLDDLQHILSVDSENTE